MRHRSSGTLRRTIRDLSGTRPVTWLLARTLHHADAYVFRLTKGRHTASNLLSGLPIVMLTTTGAKSGELRTLPLLGVPDGEDVIVVASGYGQSRYPSWYHNLKANPDAIIEVGGERRRIRTREVAGEERDRLWKLCLEVYPAFAVYESRAKERRIPIIVLKPE